MYNSEEALIIEVALKHSSAQLQLSSSSRPSRLRIGVSVPVAQVKSSLMILWIKA